MLWLYHNGDEFDPDHSLRDRIDGYWRAQSGDDPYSMFLRERGSCRNCGTPSQYEHLSICPTCFATPCPAHTGRCECGHAPVG